MKVIPLQNEILKKIIKLYETDKLSVRQIAERIGVTNQAIYSRLAGAGVPLRSREQKSKRIARKKLIQLYVREKRSIDEIARLLGAAPKRISGELRRCGIEIRSLGCATRKYSKKYSKLYQMKAGETIRIERPEVKNPVATLHGKAVNLRIKISIKSIDEHTMEIHRLK